MALSRRHFVAGAGVALLGIGYAAYDWYKTQNSPKTQETKSAATGTSNSVMDILENDNVLGDPKAPIGIVEYASLTCPHCAYFHENAFSKIEEKYVKTGKAFIIYRDFPLDQYAFQASVLAHSAGKDKFFAVLKILFSKQKEWTSASNPTDAIVAIGNMVGVSKAKFEEGIADEKLGESILLDRMVGSTDYGVSSTPTLFINGEKYEGSREFADLDAYLENL
ncbi:MAG: DsbA family protein [Sneathiella sp.]